MLRELLLCFALFVVAGPAVADDTTRCYTEKGDVKIAACTRAINSGARAPAINYNNRGMGYLRKGDNDSAIADYSEAIRINPKYATAYVNRGYAYREKGDNDRALADFSEAIRVDPKNANAYANRGYTYRLEGNNDNAIADYTQAIRLDPKNALDYYRRGIAYRSKGDNDGAIADFTDAIRIDPKDVKTYIIRGNAYRDKGDNDRAVADFTDAIRIDPKNALAYTNRGLTYKKMGDLTKARADFNSALGIPRDPAYGWPHDTARTQLASLPTEWPAPGAPPAAVSGPAHPKVSAVEPVASLPISSSAISSSVPTSVRPDDGRIALVIGNSVYENVPALPNPERDAKLVTDVLKRTGFQSVTLLTNLKKDELVSALRNFAVQAERADWAVIYYAGHGMEVGGTNYLIPVDATIAADRDIGFEAVPLEQVLNAAERAKKLRLVVLDACRDNPFKAKMKRTLTVASRSVSGGLAAIEPEAGTLVIYAAKDGQQASDGNGNNSPFTLAFVKNVQTPGLEVRRLFDYVRDDVMDATGRQQQPFSYGSISGRQDFYFVAGK
ncbi:tetratricopeptide repeat protein [Bradyrhizobium sp. CCGB12]|uniref:tetratricopeptide repeat protein n=1 Tax=Bradyrhizobium sp. CCGB12 TaxID=2949632 RepID=UPI0020B2FC02|nr:tetratricopeptide repeat protein [Bradyrhizobium sp. CCGB12]MCP3389688.1 tetratricopeptide repeat protein [Bradyrhizobium sp. CCGB12]